MKNIKEVKACPYCGEAPFVCDGTFFGKSAVSCHVMYATHAGSKVVVGKTVDVAIAKWNKMVDEIDMEKVRKVVLDAENCRKSIIKSIAGRGVSK